jgi:hypothetical protein
MTQSIPLMPESDIMEKLPLVLDLTGTFVFALSGALAGVKRRLDLFGVPVLSFAAANSGGITRDLLIGVVPPGAVADWRYLGVSLFAGLITFYFSSLIVRISNSVLIFDAAGLALFVGRDSDGTSRGTIRRRGTGSRIHRGGRAHAAVAGRPGDGGSADFMLLAPRHGDEARLAAAGRENQGSTRSAGRSGRRRFLTWRLRVSGRAWRADASDPTESAHKRNSLAPPGERRPAAPSSQLWVVNAKTRPFAGGVSSFRANSPPFCRRWWVSGVLYPEARANLSRAKGLLGNN